MHFLGGIVIFHKLDKNYISEVYSGVNKSKAYYETQEFSF